MNPVPKWGPRLARLYSEDVRRLEALHADKLSPGAKTWEAAVEALYRRTVDAGPVKGAKLIGKAIDYLDSVGRDERCHLMIASECRSRSACLMFTTFAAGDHPDRNVRERGLNIALHIILCSRSLPRCGTGIPVAYISRHAMNRLYERGHDITENSHATSLFAFVGVLGYLTHHSEKHRDGGLHMLFSDLLTAGSLHRFMKTSPDGREFEEAVYDVRTVLPADEIGERRQSLLEQGSIAADVVFEWFESEDGADEQELAERIPYLPRREDSYPARSAVARR